jgi:hypothetical protein
MNRRILLKDNYYFLVIICIYWILGILLLDYFQYCLNSDNFFYMDIAAKYASGNFNGAINGYWSPLISWMLAVLMKFSYYSYNTDFKILSLFVGFLNLLGIRLLSYRFKIDNKISDVLIISVIPFILSLSLIDSKPDLLVTIFIMAYLYIIFDYDYLNKVSNGFLCGVFGALAYLSKTYAFAFFFVHFLLFNIIYYFKCLNVEMKKNILKNMAVGFLVFFVISGLWAGTISEKYGVLTFGTTSNYNYDIVGPNQGDTVYHGLTKPWNSNLISAWEDSSYFKLKNWSPLDSYSSFMYQLNIIYANIIATFYYLELFSIFALFILLLSILVIIRKYSFFSKDIILYSILTMIIYTAGYLLILISYRYIILDYFLILVLFGYLMSNLPKNSFINSVLIRNLFLLLFLVSLIIFPVACLINEVDGGVILYNTGQILKNEYNITGNIASNGNGNQWELTLYLSYYLNGKYYGLTNGKSNDELTKELKDNNIDYYVYWNADGDNLTLPYEDITKNRFAYLKVYSIKN